MNYSLELPINNLSFGQTSLIFLREIFKLGHNPPVFPIGGQVDISSQTNLPDGFTNWLQNNIATAQKRHNRSWPVFKLWHLNGSLQSFSNEQNLLSFYELDSPTSEEVNIVKNNKRVLFSNDYSVNTFKDLGCDNVFKLVLPFDKYNFSILDKKFYIDNRISFGLFGKLELTRKHTARVIQAWIKKYGNNPKYFLNAAVFNPFIPQDQFNGLLNQICEGKRYFNVQFLNYIPLNAGVNDYLNSLDIMISMGTEGFGYPLFNALALGKYGVALNCAGHKEYCTDENCVLVQPNSKIPAYDNMFFVQGQPFNQGSVYSYDDEAFINACEIAANKAENNRINSAGIKLQEQFKSEDFSYRILETLK